MLAATLASSLLGSILSDKGVIKAEQLCMWMVIICDMLISLELNIFQKMLKSL